MKNIIMAAAVSLFPATAFADGHNGHGQGFASTVSSTTIEGKSGFVKQKPIIFHEMVTPMSEAFCIR